VRELRRLEEGEISACVFSRNINFVAALANAHKEIQQLKSSTRASGLRSPARESRTSTADAEEMEVDNTEFKDGTYGLTKTHDTGS
jgi:hypothetical protein